MKDTSRAHLLTPYMTEESDSAVMSKESYSIAEGEYVASQHHE